MANTHRRQRMTLRIEQTEAGLEEIARFLGLLWLAMSLRMSYRQKRSCRRGRDGLQRKERCERRIGRAL